MDRNWAISAVFLGLALLAGCEGDPPISVVPPPPDAGCRLPEEPRHYEVFFAIDVSGSMELFLTDVRSELEGLAIGFPETDSMGRGVRVDYYVIGFVNDYKIFGNGRMSTPIALGAALDEAIVAGRDGNNLNSETPNVEVEENLLDALGQVRVLSGGTATKLVIIATDANFVEAPAVLNPAIQVQATYQQVYGDLASLGARVHAFTRSSISGLTAPYRDQPALTSLEGSSVSDIQDLTGARERVREKLNAIARDASCN
jgi:hypothetical protein